MERLWSPWRSQYVSTAGSDEGCFLCDHLAAEDDLGRGILHRATTVFVVLNAFPYNAGHLMVSPFRHLGDLDELSVEERSELMEVTTNTVRVMRDALSPHGFNVGLNLGTAAGAGVPGHLHVHVVPRWGGDTNFMPVIGETKVLPEGLTDTAAKLRPGFDRLA